ncbi:hypothetical protein V6N11_028661 [Hibiscus sabdariffa]|uniref:Uncharacterized protein n=1 Tax=Hibiscus sabdariffa TaxID=183260 RepID=A0ABR2PQF9_9ROSI
MQNPGSISLKNYFYPIGSDSIINPPIQKGPNTHLKTTREEDASLTLPTKCCDLLSQVDMSNNTYNLREWRNGKCSYRILNPGLKEVSMEDLTSYRDICR